MGKGLVLEHIWRGRILSRYHLFLVLEWDQG